LKKVLKKLDCQYSRPGKGSHEIWKNKNGEIIPFPVHRGKDMKKGTVQKILEAATGSKLSETQIKKLLHKLG
jgi:predicted RNA binding protein YcfA (HicA-like mRNA interferase family)